MRTMVIYSTRNDRRPRRHLLKRLYPEVSLGEQTRPISSAALENAIDQSRARRWVPLHITSDESTNNKVDPGISLNE